MFPRRANDCHRCRRRDSALLECVPEEQDGAQVRVGRSEPVRQHPLAWRPSSPACSFRPCTSPLSASLRTVRTYDPALPSRRVVARPVANFFSTCVTYITVCRSSTYAFHFATPAYTRLGANMRLSACCVRGGRGNNPADVGRRPRRDASHLTADVALPSSWLRQLGE